MFTSAFWVFILIVMIVVAVILLIVLNRSGGESTTYTPPEVKSTFKKTEGRVAGTGTTTIKTAEPTKKKVPVIGKHTTVYEYIPTRGVTRCRHCDGESPYGATICCICGNYMNS